MWPQTPNSHCVRALIPFVAGIVHTYWVLHSWTRGLNSEMHTTSCQHAPAPCAWRKFRKKCCTLICGSHLSVLLLRASGGVAQRSRQSGQVRGKWMLKQLHPTRPMVDATVFLFFLFLPQSLHPSDGNRKTQSKMVYATVNFIFPNRSLQPPIGVQNFPLMRSGPASRPPFRACSFATRAFVVRRVLHARYEL